MPSFSALLKQLFYSFDRIFFRVAGNLEYEYLENGNIEKMA